MLNRLRFFRRKQSLIKKVIIYDEVAEEDACLPCEKNDSYTTCTAYIYEDGTDIDTTVDAGNIIQVEKNIEAHVQKLNKLNIQSTGDGKMTKSKARKNRDAKQNSRLILPGGVMAFDGLEELTGMEEGETFVNQGQLEMDDHTTFVNVQMDFPLSIQPSGSKRYYDLNENEENEYWINT